VDVYVWKDTKQWQVLIFFLSKLRFQRRQLKEKAILELDKNFYTVFLLKVYVILEFKCVVGSNLYRTASTKYIKKRIRILETSKNIFKSFEQ